MPSRFYSLACGHESPGSWAATPTCRTCGAPGTFAFWSLRMHEAMARYQYVYELTPVGPHRRLADELFRPLRRNCATCDGSGLRWPEGPRYCTVCGACEGTGGMWVVPEEEVRAARERILEAYPTAAAKRTGIHFLGGPLVQNLDSGEMIDLEDEG